MRLLLILITMLSVLATISMGNAQENIYVIQHSEVEVIDTEKKLSEAIRQLAEAGHDTSSHLVEGQAESVLGTYVTESGADMVVMGAYGHSRIRSLIIGSTTTEMIRSCKVPVLLFR